MRTMTPLPPRPQARHRPDFPAAGVALVLALGALGSIAGPVVGQQVGAPAVVTTGSHGSGWMGIRLDGHRVPAGAPGSVEGIRIVVTDLYRGGPAEQGGLRRGDVVVRINGKPADLQLFRSLTSRLVPGDPLALTVLREGRTLDVAITLGQAPDRGALVPLAAQGMQVQLDSARRAFTERLAMVRTRVLAEEARTVLGTVPQVHVSRSAHGDSLTTVVVVTRPDGSVIRLRETGPGSSAFAYHASSEPDSVHVRLRPVSQGEVVRLAPSRARDDRAAERVSAQWRPLRPYLVGANRVAGAELRVMDEALGHYFGARRGLLVTDVAEGTPARAAGLQAGDLVMGVDGVDVASVAELRRALGGAKGPVAIRVLRRGRVLDLTIPG